jgi:uncharacterized membrane protein YdbT with pleckstrin-like domain
MLTISENLRLTHPIRRRKILKRSCLNVLTALITSSLFTFLILGTLWISVQGHEESFQKLIIILKEPLSLIAFLLFVWVVWYPIYQYLYFSSYFYDLDKNNLYIRKGVATKRELIIPISKITDVYIDQDMADIFLGLYDLHVSTPTEESLKFAHIAGLNKKNALEIKEKILTYIHKS